VRRSETATADLVAQTTTIHHVHNTHVLEGSAATDGDTASKVVDSPDTTIRMMQFENNDIVECFPHTSIEKTALWHQPTFVQWNAAEDGEDDWWSTHLDVGTIYSNKYNCPIVLEGNIFFMRHAGTITKHKNKLHNDADFPDEFYAAHLLDKRSKDTDDPSSKDPDGKRKGEGDDTQKDATHSLQQFFDRCKMQLAEADYDELIKLNAPMIDPIFLSTFVCNELTRLFLRNLEPSLPCNKDGAFPSFLFVGSCCLPTIGQ
jgi:hypothetical protein